MHRVSGFVSVVQESNDGSLSVASQKQVGSLTQRKAAPVKQAKKLKTYTIEEVETRNTTKEAWVAIRGKVYDVTKLLDKHPGGKEMLVIASGRDATAMYESMHTEKNTKVLNKYLIGTLDKTNVPTFADRSEFSVTVEKRVLQYFKDKKIDPREAPGMIIIYTIISAVFVASFFGMFHPTISKVNFLVPWISAAINGWSAAMMGFYLCHDGCHGGFSRNPSSWAFLRRLYECFTGLSTLVWIHQHGLGHHPFTNVVGVDPDIISDDPGVLRVHETQPWWNFYGLQKYYWLPLYSQLVLSRKLTEWKNVYYDGYFKHIRINPVSWSEAIWSIITMTIYSAQHFVIPYFMWNAGFGKMMALHTITDLTWSMYLTLIFQASHVNDEVAWPQPNEDGVITDDWAKLQVEASLDFAHDDFWTTFLCGSLNYQAVHHLFPYINQWHYPALAPIVKDTCKEFGVRYNLEESVWAMIRAHVKRIELFGEEPVLR